MTMGCDRNRSAGREQSTSAAHLKDVAYRLTIVSEKVDTRGYERVISNRQQVRLRATLAKPAY
eukprot:scaffold61465_cov66-Phaeocystis_antarctica.AAC.1